MVIYPWFSRHWITIISSIINAWNWGINYQDGLDSNSIEGWLYYFKELPFAIGIQSFIFIICIAFLNFYKKNCILFNRYSISCARYFNVGTLLYANNF